MTFPVIDAHQHVWDPAQAVYSWLGPDLAPIDRAMSFAEVAPELSACAVDYTVQVQSADDPADTRLMRASAAENAEVVGIVGFAPLDQPAATSATLDSWASDPLMIGVRNLIHTKRNPDWLLKPSVMESLSVLEERGLAFDVVAVLPRHLELVPILAERFPRLRMVIDHLAKPPIGLHSNQPWDSLMTAAAACPMVYGKVSGLYSATPDSGAWTTDAIRPFFHRALELFGPRRLMYGGDWPISIMAGGYTRVWHGLRPLFEELDQVDREWVLGRSAARFYGLELPGLQQSRGAGDVT